MAELPQITLCRASLILKNNNLGHCSLFHSIVTVLLFNMLNEYCFDKLILSIWEVCTSFMFNIVK